MTYEQRLKMMLAHEFSGTTSYESCDIPTRLRIDRLVSKILKMLQEVAHRGAIGE